MINNTDLSIELETDNNSPTSLKSNTSKNQLELSNFKAINNQLKYQSNQPRVEINLKDNLVKKNFKTEEEKDDIERKQSDLTNIPSLEFSTSASNKLLKNNS
jgi:hypothetical protein